jgi:RND family efflux transporter MFP subunit
MSNEDLSGLRINKDGSGHRSARQRKRIIWFLSAAIAVVLAILAAKGIFAPKVEVETATVSQVYPSQTFTLLSASGYVVAQRKSAGAAKTTGRLVWLGVEEGSRVSAGEIIARLEKDDVTAARAQAVANLASARSVKEQAEAELKDATLALNRTRGLVPQGVMAQAELDASEARCSKARGAVNGAEAAINAAQAAVRSADVALEYTLIRAPFDAVVLTKDAEIGDIVTPLGSAVNAKAAVVTMADMNSLQVQADVSESNLEKVRVGQPCEIQLDALHEVRFAGTVHMIVPTADRSKATVMVKVRFLDKDSRILPEMSARVAFLQRAVNRDEKKPLTALNPAAIIKRNGKNCIYLIKDERVVETPVTTGKQIGDMVEILSGAKAGDKAALKPLQKLKDGTRIKTAEK